MAYLKFQKFFNSIQLLLDKGDKRKIYFVLIISLLLSLVEALGISAIMPFIALSTDKNYIFESKILEKIYNFSNLNNENQFLFLLGVLLLFFYFSRGLLNYLYYLFLHKFAHFKAHKIAYKIYEINLKVTFKEFLANSTSDITKNIIHETAQITKLIASFLIIVTEILVIIFIYTFLIYIDFKVTILLSLFLIFNLFLILKIVSKIIKSAGVKREEKLKGLYNFLTNNLNNMKFIRVSNSQRLSLMNFDVLGKEYAKSNIENARLSNVPKIYLETITFSTIIILILVLSFNTSLNLIKFLPKISVYLLAFYRLMPSLNRITNSYNQITFLFKSSEIIIKNLSLNFTNHGDKKLKFNREIIFKDIDFSYNRNKSILNNFNFRINKSEKIGILGESGSGKSSLIDLITGINIPNKGNIIVDNQILNDSNIENWRNKIGYSPQNIYLVQGDVKENILYGRVNNENRIIETLKIVGLENFFKSRNGLATFLGENGSELSGGQKQRIGIARAIYSKPEILILDEATSSLDKKTEKKIIDNIFDEFKSNNIIIISHNKEILKRCDRIFVFENGNLNEL